MNNIQKGKMRGFRKCFDFPSLSVANWFPGHMAKGMRKMGLRVQKCNCALEVHDARHIPFSGRNPNLSGMLGRCPKILVLNKMDLSDTSRLEEITQSLRRQGEKEVIFTNCQTQHHKCIPQLMSAILEVVRQEEEESNAIKLMVMGMPNVGKSSLVNALRRNYLKKGKATRVGALPGVTRAVQYKILVSEDPMMYLFDTPGVMMPSIPNGEVAMKLAVIGMLPDHRLGERVIADYLLFILNQHEEFEYVKYYDLPQPCDDVEEALDYMAKRIGALHKGGIYDHTRAAQHFLRQFRNGKLGHLILDELTYDKD